MMLGVSFERDLHAEHWWALANRPCAALWHPQANAIVHSLWGVRVGTSGGCRVGMPPPVKGWGRRTCRRRRPTPHAHMLPHCHAVCCCRCCSCC